MELSPNQLVLLLRIREVYLRDDFLRNGFRSRNDLSANVENSFSPSKTLRDFTRFLMDCDVLFLQGSLKLNIVLCDELIASNSNFLLCWKFAKEKAIIIEDPFK